jgi:hypothetical protein
MATIVLKSGDRLQLELEEGDGYELMKGSGVMQIDTLDGQRVYLRSNDILCILEDKKP